MTAGRPRRVRKRAGGRTGGCVRAARGLESVGSVRVRVAPPDGRSHPRTGRQRKTGSTAVVESSPPVKPQGQAVGSGDGPGVERAVARSSDQTPIQPAQSASPAESNSEWPDLTVRLRLIDVWMEVSTQALREGPKSGWQDRLSSLRLEDQCESRDRRLDAGLSFCRSLDGRVWQDQPSPKDRD